MYLLWKPKRGDPQTPKITVAGAALRRGAFDAQTRRTCRLTVIDKWSRKTFEGSQCSAHKQDPLRIPVHTI